MSRIPSNGVSVHQTRVYLEKFILRDTHTHTSIHPSIHYSFWRQMLTDANFVSSVDCSFVQLTLKPRSNQFRIINIDTFMPQCRMLTPQILQTCTHNSISEVEKFKNNSETLSPWNWHTLHNVRQPRFIRVTVGEGLLLFIAIPFSLVFCIQWIGSDFYYESPGIRQQFDRAVLNDWWIDRKNVFSTHRHNQFFIIIFIQDAPCSLKFYSRSRLLQPFCGVRRHMKSRREWTKTEQQQ